MDMTDTITSSAPTAVHRATARACTARSPAQASAHNGLGWTLFQLGDFDAACDSFERASKLEDNAQWRSDLLMSRYFAGRVGKAELQRLAQ